MLKELFIDRIELVLALWAILYISDYYLTVWAARLYRSSTSSHISIEGSLEITPYFREDIDAARLISTRFLRVLVLSLLVVTFAWIITVRTLGAKRIFEAILGGFFLLEATAHIRHIRNIALMRQVRRNQGLKGKIEYPRWLSLEISAIELSGFSFLFLVISVFTRAYFFAGGALTCLLTGMGHLLWSRKSKAAAVKPEVETQAGNSIESL